MKMFDRISFRRRKVDSNEEIQEIHDLIENVYESIDDQARASIVSFNKFLDDDQKSKSSDEIFQTILKIGHSICCGLFSRRNSFRRSKTRRNIFFQRTFNSKNRPNCTLKFSSRFFFTNNCNFDSPALSRSPKRRSIIYPCKTKSLEFIDRTEIREN